MRTLSILHGLAGFMAMVGLVAQASAAQCMKDTPITGGGLFSADCSTAASEAEATGSSNAATGFVQVELFRGAASALSFGSLRNAGGLLCIAEDDGPPDGVPSDPRQGAACAGATLVRVIVVD